MTSLPPRPPRVPPPPPQEPLVQKMIGINGLPKVRLCNTSGFSVEVYEYGAHITSWKNEKGEDLLFLSTQSKFKKYEPLLGGIPICFPQYYHENKDLPERGFARCRDWKIDNSPPPLPDCYKGDVSIDFILTPVHVDRLRWAHEFELRLRVALDTNGDLLTVARIKNVHNKAFHFSFGFDNHLAVSAIEDVRVEGLQGTCYFDKLIDNGEVEQTEQESLTLEAKVDRLYETDNNKITVCDHGITRTIVARREGLPKTAIWNPWNEEGRMWNPWRKTHLAKDEYKKMVGVAAVVVLPLSLKPGEDWQCSQRLHAVENSYCTSSDEA